MVDKNLTSCVLWFDAMVNGLMPMLTEVRNKVCTHFTYLACIHWHTQAIHFDYLVQDCGMLTALTYAYVCPISYIPNTKIVLKNNRLAICCVINVSAQLPIEWVYD